MQNTSEERAKLLNIIQESIKARGYTRVMPHVLNHIIKRQYYLTSSECSKILCDKLETIQHEIEFRDHTLFVDCEEVYSSGDKICKVVFLPNSTVDALYRKKQNYLKTNNSIKKTQTLEQTSGSNILKSSADQKIESITTEESQTAQNINMQNNTNNFFIGTVVGGAVMTIISTLLHK